MLRGRAFAEDECHYRCERSRWPWPRQQIPRFHSFKMFHDHHFSTFFHIFHSFFIHFSTFFLCLVLSFENTGRTALHCAAHNGKTSVAQILLANGAKVDETDGEGLLSRSQKMVFIATEDQCIDKIRLKWERKELGV